VESSRVSAQTGTIVDLDLDLSDEAIFEDTLPAGYEKDWLAGAFSAGNTAFGTNESF